MGERKVLNRYIPPDFDPSIIPKFKRDRNKLIEVRMMLPFSLRCNTCSEYMYRGKKFNSKVERTDENYMGIRKLRFYIKCSVCSAEITFKTDPQNADYECESGASRNFELWRDTASAMEEEAKERAEDEQDAMKALEHKTMDNKTEMDVLDALDEIRAINQRHRRVDTNKVLEIIANKQQQGAERDKEREALLTEEDEALIKSIHFGKGKQREELSAPSSSASSSSSVLTGAVSATDDLVSRLQKQISSTQSQTQTHKPLGATLIVKKKRKADDGKTEDAVANKKSAASAGENSKETIGEAKTVSVVVGSSEEKESETDKQTAVTETAKETATAADADSDAGAGLLGLLGDYGADSE